MSNSRVTLTNHRVGTFSVRQKLWNQNFHDHAVDQLEAEESVGEKVPTGGRRRGLGACSVQVCFCPHVYMALGCT